MVKDIKKGDVVKLAAIVTREEFGVALRNENGDFIMLDGIVQQVLPHIVQIRMRRLLKPLKHFAPEEHSISRWVRVEQIIDVLDGEATLWPMLTDIREAAARRDGVRRPMKPVVHWVVGEEPIPTD